MKIVVAIKRVLDPSVRVRPDTTNTRVENTGGKHVINPFCEIAVEQAVRFKEQQIATEVVTVSIGDDSTAEQLRSALALGADRGILVRTTETLESLAIAKILQKIVDVEKPDLILLGKQSVDSDNNHTGQMLAGLCGFNQATFASNIELLAADSLKVTREIDSGLEVRSLKLPAVVTVDLRLNTPRYPTMPNIMKARQKPLAVIELSTLGIDAQNRLQVVSVSHPKQRSSGVKVNDVSSFIAKLQELGAI